jgi:non-ribosomal peptide synthetase component F
VIGRPLDNVGIKIGDKTGEPAPIGIPGEICIGGAGVSRGYLNRPELTTERFTPEMLFKHKLYKLMMKIYISYWRSSAICPIRVLSWAPIMKFKPLQGG